MLFHVTLVLELNFVPSLIQIFFGNSKKKGFWLQIFAMPVFDMIETVLVKKLHFPPGLALRLIARSTYVGNVAF
jgi:hypothetical protein